MRPVSDSAAIPPAPGTYRRGWVWAILLWCVSVVAAIGLRPLLPVDETRYAAVAWEMHVSGDWLVPHLNGQPYHHKPPLLFWLMNLGWSIGGVGEIWTRLVAPLCGLAALLLSAALSRRMWPGRPRVPGLAALILLGSTLFTLFTTLIFFDVPLTASVLLGWLGLWKVARDEGRTGWILVALGIGLGALFKGPVVLLHVGLAIVLAPAWLPQRPVSWSRWYGKAMLMILLGASLALAWALPAARAGGEEFSRMLFFGQHAGRIVKSFQHAKPFWWYLVLLPGILFPWTLWGGSWRSAKNLSGWRQDPALRFVVFVFVADLAVFSLISGKQPQYLLPLFPLVAMGLARILEATPFTDSKSDRIIPVLLSALIGLVLLLGKPIGSWLVAQNWIQPLPEVVSEISPGWGLAWLALAGLVFFDKARTLEARVISLTALITAWMTLGQAIYFGAEREKFDLKPISQSLAKAQEAGREVSLFGGYQGQFHFTGRLSRPLVLLQESNFEKWASDHPDALVVVLHRRLPQKGLAVQPEFIFPHRGRMCCGWRARDLMSLGHGWIQQTLSDSVSL